MLIVFEAFSLVCLARCLKFSLGSRYSLRILGFLTFGMVLLFIVRSNVVLYSDGSGVKSVAVDLSAFSCKSFSFVQLKMSFRYGCSLFSASFILWCEDRVFISSAYDSILIWGGGVGMSDVHMLKRTGDNTPPCGTPVFSSLCFDLLSLYRV